MIYYECENQRYQMARTEIVDEFMRWQAWHWSVVRPIKYLLNIAKFKGDDAYHVNQFSRYHFFSEYAESIKVLLATMKTFQNTSEGPDGFTK